MHNSNDSGMRVLVAGSSRMTHQRLFYKILDQMNSMYDFGTVITGPFSGADAIARSWAKEHSVKLEQLIIPEHEKLEISFYNAQREIPLALLEKDAFFARSFARIQSASPNALLLIPGPEGVLGPTCACLARMAQIIDMPIINTADILVNLEARTSQFANENGLIMPPSSTVEAIDQAMAMKTTAKVRMR